MKSLRPQVSIGALTALVLSFAGPGQPTVASPAQIPINCSNGTLMCAEVHDSEEVFGQGVYVGHDEPSVLFYSNQPGSGNRMRYQLTLPKDPPNVTTNTFNFELHPAFWFGMALCDTQSYPEQVRTCTPNSDSNITPNLKDRPGNGFMELQFYPPGFAPQPVAFSCDATKWCSAMVTFGLSEDPIAGTLLNPTCASRTGIEYPNFAYLTKSGVPTAPPNPVTGGNNRFVVDKNADLFMNSGDRLSVTMHDTDHGLFIQVDDLTTGGSGFMTASAGNGFGSPRFAPKGSSCKLVPLDYHPMYSTSSEQTRVIWAAHSYNIAFSDEIGHFDFCTAISGFAGNCLSTAKEGSPRDQEASDGDDNACFGPADSTLVQVTGCEDTNTGFDGVSYQPVWPDGSPKHPTPVLFSSPRTGSSYSVNYNRMAFEADLPRIEAADFGGQCDRNTGVGCTNPPVTDDTVNGDRQPATFYPFYSTGTVRHQCTWLLGNDVPGLTRNDFGKTAQYGSLFFLNYLRFGGGGVEFMRINDFRQVLGQNPCPAGSGGSD